MATRLRAIIFDLDDTLYAEADYIASGYRTVCSILAERGFKVTVDEMFAFFRESRDHVFDLAASHHQFPREWVSELVEAYRSHTPTLTLEHETRSVLELLRQDYKIGILTDGWKNVQQTKIDALQVHQYCDTVIIADEFGRDYWKPNPAILRICCERLGVSTAETLFVGDNPERDLACAHAAQMACVRIRRGNGYFRSAPSDYEPDAEISTLEELPLVLRKLDQRDPSPNGAASVLSVVVGGR
jgi:putative hydrolase of the HAD superfamily